MDAAGKLGDEFGYAALHVVIEDTCEEITKRIKVEAENTVSLDSKLEASTDCDTHETTTSFSDVLLDPSPIAEVSSINKEQREILFARFAGKARAMALHWTRPGVEADDLEGEAILGLYEVADEKGITATEDEIAARMRSKVRHFVYLSLRELSTDDPDIARETEKIPAPGDSPEDFVYRSELDKLVATLPHSEQVVIENHFGLKDKQMTLQEIADELGISVGTAWNLQQKALTELRQQLSSSMPKTSNCSK